MAAWAGGEPRFRHEKEYSTKLTVKEDDKPKAVAAIDFGMHHGTDMSRFSYMQVVNSKLYDMPDRKQAAWGVLDQRLGQSGKQDAPVVFGHIEFALPVFHAGFLKTTVGTLQCVCKRCSRVLLRDDQRARVMRSMRDPRTDNLQKIQIRKKVIADCKKINVCTRCGAANGVVKRVQNAPGYRVVHDVHKIKTKAAEEAWREDVTVDSAAAQDHNPELSAHVNKAGETLTPRDALRILQAIPDEDCDLLWHDPTRGRPEALILTHLYVPPVAIRPSVQMDAGGGSNEDDLTVTLQSIVDVNNSLAKALESGATVRSVVEMWDWLQLHVATYINGELPGVALSMRPKKPIRGLCQRLKGKQGRFRGNLSGKRVDFSGRTVISPDPNLQIHEVGVPRLVARILTFPERVTQANLTRLRRAVANGTKFPGANFIRKPRGGGQESVVSLKFGDSRERARRLQVGDVVDRHLQDGDVVLFNRQPSLHKVSIMAHRVRVKPWRTFRFNECVCAPYNADFDGDEMNLHLPQTEEARAEAALLMDVRENLVTPRSGQPLVSATQDFLTAAFLLTQRDVFLTREEMSMACAALAGGAEQIDLPPPCVLKPVPLWSGKQVFTVLLAPGGKPWPVSIELKARNYSGSVGPEGSVGPGPAPGQQWGVMCPEDGYVMIRDGQLLAGNLCKSSLGGSNKGLVHALLRDVNSHAAAQMMHRLTCMCTRWLTQFGFSIGLEDVMPSDLVTTKKEATLSDGYSTSDNFIAQFNAGTLELQPGCDEEESLEAVLNRTLGKLRDTVGQMCVRTLPFHNAPRIMASCGSKGSTLNIAQMVACLGQQSVGGKRIPNGFASRSLPIFLPRSREPGAKGFVASSFYTGLSATEFFFHTMGGREGLVDTAVKTAETGYMQRRMVKALEDLSVMYDGTVRTSALDVVQFQYGEDGLDPAVMEVSGRPVNLVRLLDSVKATFPRRQGERCMLPGRIESYLRTRLAEPQWSRTVGVQSAASAEQLCREVLAFFGGLASSMRLALGHLDMEDADEELEAHAEIDLAEEERKAAVAGAQVGYEALALRNAFELTQRQLDVFLLRAHDKFMRGQAQPGEAVGAVGAHSLGEPATQMTLKTFHFAGVASMNVTLGVPRIKEIMNASKTISTPIIEAALVDPRSEAAARIVKGRIERTRLGDIAVAVTEVADSAGMFVEVELDLETIARLQLSISNASVVQAIVSAPKLRIKDVNISSPRADLIRISPPDKGNVSTRRRAAGALERDAFRRSARYFAIQELKQLLPEVVVAGVPTVTRAVITHDEEKERGGGGSYYKLLVEGTGISAVMGTAGVRGLATKTNHVIETEQVLGIEAARSLIMTELEKTYGSYGIDIDGRHLMLLADVMTYKGEVLGVTRFGIAKMKDSVLMLASFEKTPDHLFDAAVHAKTDRVLGVSECIVVGRPCSLGTGAFKLTLADRESTALASQASADLERQKLEEASGAEAEASGTDKPPQLRGRSESLLSESSGRFATQERGTRLAADTAAAAAKAASLFCSTSAASAAKQLERSSLLPEPSVPLLGRCGPRRQQSALAQPRLWPHGPSNSHWRVASAGGVGQPLAAVQEAAAGHSDEDVDM